ncbi:large ribosomal subunit protein mL52 isoform X1 [Poecile atricapillus]|uniref:large ribosomal subunit protein mL52 isoform X1 n=1 Tax=Poecile atricapillus TaxID=48891 RepID=UPI00273887A9|nr:large ribosomal subunit protein mL52 isoform X1 [Poecile atricapillus]
MAAATPLPPPPAACVLTSLPSASKMASRRILRLAERQARSLRPLPRPPPRIGQWRESFGLSPSPSGPGPLRDLPDWSFAVPGPGSQPLPGGRQGPPEGSQYKPVRRGDPAPPPPEAPPSAGPAPFAL